MQGSDRFAAASFSRCGHDSFARVLEKHGLLDFYALGTRRGTAGVSPEHTRLQPIFGLLNYAAACLLPPFRAEAFRFRLFPWFDRWVKSQLRPGQHLFTSYGFANQSLRWIKKHGGLTFIDAGNAHPQEFWALLTEEGERWGSPHPPVSRFFNEQALETANTVDYVFTPSTWVRNSYLRRGFDERRLLLFSYPVNLQVFCPAPEPRPVERPLTILNTGLLCLRKGTPYLLEAFRLIRKEEPRAVLRLTRVIADDFREVLRRFADLPIDWTERLDLSDFVRRYQTSDIFVLPSIEDGFAFVVAEALACGLPVITTPNTGASDLIQNGQNGEVVPIRDPDAIAAAVLKWWAKIREGRDRPQIGGDRSRLNTGHFERTLLEHLSNVGIRKDGKPWHELAGQSSI